MNASVKPVLSSGKAILWGGLAAGVLDAVDGVVAFGTQGLNPIQVLQYIASGCLGQRAFTGGLATAGLGALLHFFIAFVVAAAYVLSSRWLPAIGKRPFLCGLLYGAGVYFFTNYLVLPLSAVAPGPFKLGLFLNGVVGHAIFVGLPIAWFARGTASYRHELSQLGIDVLLVQPSAYPTNMYAAAQQPRDAERATAYGEIGAIPGKMFETFMGIFTSPGAPNPHDVAEATAKLIATPKGQRPERVVVGQAFGSDAVNSAVAPIQRQVVEGLGLGVLAAVEG